jgi:prepilin-type N-terminal cleavage/methylation domain-containing protein/prepilin-type processing-associated H-X9-DG protein
MKVVDRNWRRAFTLIELLVVIAIIAIMMGLLVPAVQKVREAANKMRCGNDLKQFGIALHSYHNDVKRLPFGGRYRNFNVPSWGANWGEVQGSWLVYTLPYMEQKALYDQYEPFIKNDGAGSFSIYSVAGTPPPPPKYMRCASADNDFDARRGASYVGSLGPQCAIGPCGFDPQQVWCQNLVVGSSPPIGIPWSPDHGNTLTTSELRGVFNRLGAKCRFEDVTDGVSNTIFVGEVLPHWHDHGWNWMDTNGMASHAGTLPPINYPTDRQVDCATDPPRSHQNWNLAWGFKSRHAGGCNFLMGDGSVQFLPQTIDHQLYQYLGCRNDANPTGILPSN